jgi:Bifunctional DNA primase/polymerase, N-terminal
MAHTPSGGLHIYFTLPSSDIRNTSGKRGRGIGPGLDWRGTGGYVIAPSSSGGYAWDPHHVFETERLAAVPTNLLPRESDRPRAKPKPIEPTNGLSPYGAAALEGAVRAIVGAPAGEQETTLNGEAFSIGTLAGAGSIPPELARRALIFAAQRIRDYDARRPWRAIEIERKINHAFDAGLRQPRAVCHG